MLIKEVAEIIFSFPQKTQNPVVNVGRWLSSNCLQEDNKLLEPQEEYNFISDENLKVYRGDIVIKRVQPQYVNYISSDKDFMIGQNLAIVRAKRDVDSKYLAFIIETNLKNLYKDMAGTVVPALTRNCLDELDIGELPDIYKQQAMGEVWWLMKEKRKLNESLLQYEKILLEYQLKQLINKRGN